MSNTSPLGAVRRRGAAAGENVYAERDQPPFDGVVWTRHALASPRSRRPGRRKVLIQAIAGGPATRRYPGIGGGTGSRNNDGGMLPLGGDDCVVPVGAAFNG